MTADVESNSETSSSAPPLVLRVALWAAVVITVVIVAASFVLSFSALWDLATLAGLPRELSWLWPVVVDGTILQATISVVALAPYEEQRSGRRFFWSVLAVSAMVSIASNALHAVVTDAAVLPPLLAAAIATAAPISLLAATHGIAVLFQSKVRVAAPVRRQAPEQAPVEALVDPAPELPTADEQHSVSTPEVEQPVVVEQDSWDHVAADMTRDQLTTRPAAEVAQILRLRYERDLSKTQIARELRLHHSTVGRVIDASAGVLRPQASVDAPLGRRRSVPRHDPAAGVLSAVR
ncbi:DUF2637 domain-containing protein [Antrihabitans stalagmiti]|uniref:DUF2637 domain-containing protein n=1 Tax=Antrihabitans stalagmiti TaxID=2799499 RepID=UPI0027DCA090|nr:DUF2637 domain-containing protein [Antrihabitans stalagmiti]